MTEQEAKQCIQGKLDCMNKCDVFDCKGTDECESCNYCYAQGNFGEQKKAFEMGIKALEEVEKLREENRALKNRCYIFTRGTMCLFCPMDCGDRKEKFRGNEDAE
jgi:hypothetical protein